LSSARCSVVHPRAGVRAAATDTTVVPATLAAALTVMANMALRWNLARVRRMERRRLNEGRMIGTKWIW
jgi:hypothetical protein